MKRKYFGTNGIRGVVGERINPKFVSRMSSAIASYMLDKGTMAIGVDSRISSPTLKNSIIASFLANGIEVIDVGMVPTPLLQFAVPFLKADMGIMVTASHNPPEFNGMKIIDSDGIEIDIHKQIQIEQQYEKEEYQYVSWNENKKTAKMDVSTEYIEQIINLVDFEKIRKKNLTAVVDGGNGVGSLITPLLLRKLGVKVVSLNCQLDGNFPGRGVEPVPDKLSLMNSITTEIGADFSVAHDGDADRAIFGDNKGHIHFGDKSIALFEKWVLGQSDNKKFVTPISSSSIMVDIINEEGGEIFWTPVGCIYVSRKMIEKNCILGGEENGGLFYGPHQSVRDGMMAAALMAEILANSEKSLNELLSDFPHYYQRKNKLQCPENIKEDVMQYIILNAEEAEEIITIDGVKLLFSDGWTLIRPSGTEPIFRIFVEAKTAEKADVFMKNGLELVRNAIEKSIGKLQKPT
ncbi:MAG: phosphoglucosamine mutase [Candidatus Heimdallarchaeota archaeon]|nr:phosphoglucosamine mutase [Candidatus Heimdallarchaeota archaeon]